MMGNVSPRAVGAYRLADALSALLIYHTGKNLVNRPRKNIFQVLRSLTQSKRNVFPTAYLHRRNGKIWS